MKQTTTPSKKKEKIIRVREQVQKHESPENNKTHKQMTKPRTPAVLRFVQRWLSSTWHQKCYEVIHYNIRYLDKLV